MNPALLTDAAISAGSRVAAIISVPTRVRPITMPCTIIKPINRPQNKLVLLVCNVSSLSVPRDLSDAVWSLAKITQHIGNTYKAINQCTPNSSTRHRASEPMVSEPSIAPMALLLLTSAGAERIIVVRISNHNNAKAPRETKPRRVIRVRDSSVAAIKNVLRRVCMMFFVAHRP